MSYTRPSRVRSQPHRLAHEQEDEQLRGDEMAALLTAIRLSTEPADDSTDSDSDAGEDESDEKVDEAKLVSSLDEKEREIYNKRRAEEEKDGWTTQHSSITVQSFLPPPAVPRPILAGCTTPLHFFHALLPPTFIDYLVERTNVYGEGHAAGGQENRPPAASTREQSTHHQPWRDTTNTELLAFLGCVLSMGMVKANDTKDYWDKDLGPPFVTRIFPRDRFLQLHRNLALSNPIDPSAATDPLHRVRHLIDLIIKQSQAAYYPNQHLSVDEAMVGFKGRTALKVHIPGKAADTGYKVWMLVDCHTGYVYNFQVYEGKGDTVEVGQTARVVNDLIMPLQPQLWHVIGMDNFFTSAALYDSLLQRGFYAVGTARSNYSGFPRSLLCINDKLKPGQWLMRQRGSLVCVSWVDRQPVNLMSTYCDPTQEATVQRWRKKRKGEQRAQQFDRSCPVVVKEYVQWMRGVDVFSQQESYTRIGRRTWRSWPRLAWFIIDMAISNAFVLYHQHTQQAAAAAAAAGAPPLPAPAAAASHKSFRRALMHELVGTFTARKKRGRPSSAPKLAANEPQHIPLHRAKPASCTVCAHKMRVRMGENKPRTRDGCETCGVAVHFSCWKEHLPKECNEEEEEEQ